MGISRLTDKEEIVTVPDYEIVRGNFRSASEYVQSHVQAKIVVLEVFRLDMNKVTVVRYRLAQEES